MTGRTGARDAAGAGGRPDAGRVGCLEASFPPQPPEPGARSPAPEPALAAERSFAEMSGLVRIGVPGRLSLFGASLTHERELLRGAGADINGKNKDKNTALHEAVLATYVDITWQAFPHLHPQYRAFWATAGTPDEGKSGPIDGNRPGKPAKRLNIHDNRLGSGSTSARFSTRTRFEPPAGLEGRAGVHAQVPARGRHQGRRQRRRHVCGRI